VSKSSSVVPPVSVPVVLWYIIADEQLCNSFIVLNIPLC
jgi:hypothetical protein